MNLKDFLVKKTGGKEYFWALVIEPGWIQAGIWETGDNKAEVTSVSTPVAWETEEELVNASDTVLSSAIQSLPEEGPEPTKTVFGVPPSWVSGGQIKEEHLEKIKKICSELSLTPSGFVVLPEAIAHLVKSEEGAPLNAIVVGLAKDSLEIAVFKLGNLAGTTSVARSISVSDDVIEGLSRFADAEALPSRFVIYDGKEGDLEEVKQALINTSWGEIEKVKFLHAPKVEILLPDKKVLATALAGASEIANVSILETKGKDEVPKPVPAQETAPEALGFSVGKDVAKAQLSEASPAKAGLLSKLKTPLGKVLSSVKSFRPRISFPNFSGLTGGKTSLFGLGFLLVLLILGFAFWWFYPKADVTIFVSAKRLEEKLDVVLDPDSKSPDLTKNILPARVVKSEVSGEKTKGTTGIKTVGDRSKGVVRIQNGTAVNINLPAGTILTATNDLKYSLDKSASVSAALSPTAPGTVTIEVSAGDIGATYNLAKDESFKVGNYPKAEVDAVSTVDFSGGSSREISAVDAQDQTSLEKELTEELLDKAKSELSQNTSNEELLISESLLPTVSSKVFSNKAGDEATNLKLTLEINVSGFVVAKKDLGELYQGIFKDKSPSGFVLRESQIDYSFDLKDDEGGNDFEVTVTANFLPEAKPDEIAKQIAGKLPHLAESYLTSIPGFSRAEVTIKPKFPGRLGTLPHVAKNITIEVEAER